MAVNETIVTGRKFRKLTDAASKKWQRISFWHKASDCEFNDGKTAEEKLGAIKGITTDLNVTVPGYAADATRVSELNNSLNGIKFAKDTNGKWGYYEAGADSVSPFSSGKTKIYTKTIAGNNSFTIDVSDISGYKKLNIDNFCIMVGSIWIVLTQTLAGINANVSISSYNASTGIVTCNASIKNGNNTVAYNTSVSVNVCLVVATNGFSA